MRSVRSHGARAFHSRVSVSRLRLIYLSNGSQRARTMPRTPMPSWPKRRRTMTLAALSGTRCERTAHARLSLAKYVRSWSEKIVDRLSRAQRVRLFRRPAVEMLLRCLGIGFRAMDRTVDVLRRSIDGVELQQLVAGVAGVVR